MGKETAAQKGYHHGSHDMDRDKPNELLDFALTADPKAIHDMSEENKDYGEGYDEGKDDKEASDAKEEKDAAKEEKDD